MTTDFQNPWRENFEAKQASLWVTASAVTMVLSWKATFFPRFGVLIGATCLAIAAVRGSAAYKRYVARKRVENSGKEFIKFQDILEITKKAAGAGALWVGKGFLWTDVEAIRLHQLLSQGAVSTLGDIAAHKEGAHWIHGIQEEDDVTNDLANLVGHTLLVATTRAGKTRMLDLMIAQAIIRGETVIIIDPKGDHELAANAKKICELIGQPDRFKYFHPGHPDKSISIDPMRNWNRKTELASRIAALIPSETGADPFTAFGWKVLNDITNGLLTINKRPNLVQLRRYIEGGTENLVIRALRTYYEANVHDWEVKVAPFRKRFKNAEAEALIGFYKEVVVHEAQSSDMEGLISTFEHDGAHFSKMVASLIPIMAMLTSEPLNDLLSPDFGQGHERQITDMARVIRNGEVLYVGLDSLSDPTVGSAIGSILLADLVAVSGDRYNYGLNEKSPVNVYIDEAAEVVNQPTIQMMNKAGGANFRVTIATQTYADFATRLGSADKARQVLGNVNNTIALRVIDAETQQFLADSWPKVSVPTMGVRYGHNVDTKIHDEFTASYQESVTYEDKEFFPPAMLGQLPPLHYIARFLGGRTVKGRIPILLA